MVKTLAPLALLCLFAGTARANIIHVPGDFPDIQSAIASAASGDTILVRPGTYVERIDFLGKDLTVKSTAGAAVTTISGSSPAPHSVVYFKSGEGPGAVLQGFTIRDGETGNGAAGSIGGGLYILGSSPTILDCVITANEAISAGGLYAEDSSVVIRRTTVSNNTAEPGTGGGLWFEDCDPLLDQVTIEGHSSGAVYCQSAAATFTACTVRNNLANTVGGAVYLASSQASFTDCDFEGNDGFASDGGALLVRNSTATLERCTFSDNIATFDDHRGGAILLESGSVTCLNGTFTGNESARGGAIASLGGTLVVEDTIFRGNSAFRDGFAWDGNGGGLFVGSGSATVRRSVFDGNSADSGFASFGGQGGAVYGPAVLEHCTILNNTATATSGGGAEEASLSNSIHWFNSPAAMTSTTTATYSCIEGGFPGLGNIASDPLLTNPSGGGYLLTTSSPCIDAGNPLSPLDPDGTTADMGAYVFLQSVPAYCTAGISASGCQALLGASGTPSASASSGFVVTAAAVEGLKDGLYFFGTNGQQANSWGNGTSYQCVVPPVVRAPTMTGTGTLGACDGSFALDLNALWCPVCPKPQKNPGPSATVQLQLWYRDPLSTSNQTTSLSDAIEFTTVP